MYFSSQCKPVGASLVICVFDENLFNGVSFARRVGCFVLIGLVTVVGNTLFVFKRMSTRTNETVFLKQLTGYFLAKGKTLGKVGAFKKLSAKLARFLYQKLQIGD